MGYGEYYCWIGSQVGSLIFLAVPMAVVIVTNIVLYTLTVASIKNVSSSVPGRRHNAKKDLMLYVRIFCVLGFTWMFGLLTLLVPLRNNGLTSDNFLTFRATYLVAVSIPGHFCRIVNFV